MMGNAQQFFVLTEQPKIDAPGVDADAGNLSGIELHGSPQPAGHVLPQSHQWPMHVACRVDAAIVEPIHFLQIYPAAVKQACDDASTGGTEIDSKEDLV